MINPGNKSVVREWLYPLTWKQQTVLLSALRGCDAVGKNDLSKKLIRGLRSVVLYNADADGNSDFMKCDLADEELYTFSKDIDKYPIHFLLHLVHAAEIVGYFHPDPDIAEWWNKFYLMMVSGFHMYPETKEQNIERLKDGTDTCCHKT